MMSTNSVPQPDGPTYTKSAPFPGCIHTSLWCTYLNGRSPVKVGHHHDGRAGDEDAEGDAVVELEGAIVDERLLLLEVATEVADLAVHRRCRWSPLSAGRRRGSRLRSTLLTSLITRTIRTHKFRHSVRSAKETEVSGALTERARAELTLVCGQLGESRTEDSTHYKRPGV